VLAAEGAAIGVVVVALRPGLVDTQMQEEVRSRQADGIPPDLRAVYAAYKQKGMLVPPERPARMIANLCTARASEINGRVLEAPEAEALLAR
jgi:NAD(P)-dependent dehydrogenase (short-subunit alcohol dehydrogenase family)